MSLEKPKLVFMPAPPGEVISDYPDIKDNRLNVIQHGTHRGVRVVDILQWESERGTNVYRPRLISPHARTMQQMIRDYTIEGAQVAANEQFHVLLHFANSFALAGAAGGVNHAPKVEPTRSNLKIGDLVYVASMKREQRELPPFVAQVMGLPSSYIKLFCHPETKQPFNVSKARRENLKMQLRVLRKVPDDLIERAKVLSIPNDAADLFQNILILEGVDQKSRIHHNNDLSDSARAIPA